MKLQSIGTVTALTAGLALAATQASAQTIGVVTDVGMFLTLLADKVELARGTDAG